MESAAVNPSWCSEATTGGQAASFNKSPSIAKLAAALAKAQLEIKASEKESENPFYKSKYSSLTAVWYACKDALNKQGIAVSQLLSGGDGKSVHVTTILMHESGEWLSTLTSAVPKDLSPQAAGSAWSYLRRYSLAAIVGVTPEDDDGEAAQPRQETRQIPKPGDIYQGKPEQKNMLVSLCMKHGIKDVETQKKFHLFVMDSAAMNSLEKALVEFLKGPE